MFLPKKKRGPYVIEGIEAWEFVVSSEVRDPVHRVVHRFDA